MSEPGAVSQSERNWAMIAHLSALTFLVSVIGGMLAPLIVYLLRKDDMPFAAQQAREALNFQITMFLLAIVGWILVVLIITAPLGILLLIAIFIADIVLTIVGAIKAGEGVAYRYPFNLRLIR